MGGLWFLSRIPKCFGGGDSLLNSPPLPPVKFSRSSLSLAMSILGNKDLSLEDLIEGGREGREEGRGGRGGREEGREGGGRGGEGGRRGGEGRGGEGRGGEGGTSGSSLLGHMNVMYTLSSGLTIPAFHRNQLP